jgi:hypothetical protein
VVQLKSMLVLATLVASTLLLAGCGGTSQAEQDGEHAELDLRPHNGFGVSGTATFQAVTDGVIVKLELHDLPKPGKIYLAHIHPGTCPQAEEAKEPGGHEHAATEIEFPLSPVKSDAEGKGASTTTLRYTSLTKLFTGQQKHINVHASGSGYPPVLACADLKERA